MKMTMRAKTRNTGYIHNIINETINPKKVNLNEDGTVSIKIDIKNIETSGNFIGDISLSLSELSYLIGILEEKKLQLLMHKISE
ncbi:MAG: hypothetical protein Rhims3KO_17210 [Hyphomicrobiales bacterium]